MAESEEKLKSLLMKLKQSEKVALKLNIQKTKIMASGPITSWEIEEMKQVTDFTFLASKIKADGDSSEMKDTYSLEKNYDKTGQNIKKQRHYFANKGLA